jgi:hypothetical protein
VADAPVVILVDDDNQSSFAAALNGRGVDAYWLHPLDVTAEDIGQATLLVVDEYFNLRDATSDAEYGALPESLPVSVVPNDGVALAAVLRSAAEAATRDRPLGVCLRTAQLDLLTVGIPHAVRQPWFSASRDLEWITTKEAGTPAEREAEIVGLAKALETYPTTWPTRQVLSTGLDWLRVPAAEWADDARRQIAQCRPPRDADSSQTRLAWFRWLAHRALPYPTFVVSEIRLAARLGVTPASLRTTLQADLEFAAQLERLLYAGPLHELQLARYWRAGVRALAVEAVGDEVEAEYPSAVAEALIKKFPSLEPLGLEQPVVCIDSTYAETGDIADQTVCMRLLPDGWPAYADGAWKNSADGEGGFEDLLAPRLR